MPRERTAKTASKKKDATRPKAAASKGPKPSAGKKILTDLGIDDAALAAYVPKSGPVLAAVFACRFDSPLTRDEIAETFSAAGFRSKIVKNVKFPPGAPREGIEVHEVMVEVPGKYVAWTFSQRDGHWVLEAYFREMGTFWGSNHAVFERFKQVELPRLRAKALVDLKTDLRG